MSKVPWGRETLGRAGRGDRFRARRDGHRRSGRANPMAGLYASFAGPVALTDDPAEGAVQGQ